MIAAFSGTNMTIASKPSDSDIGEGPPVAPADPSVWPCVKLFYLFRIVLLENTKLTKLNLNLKKFEEKKNTNFW